MAWAVRSWLIGVLALSTSFIWFMGFQSDHQDQSASVYPLILAVSLLPLASIIRSRVLYAGTLLVIITAACVIAGDQGSGRQSPPAGSLCGPSVNSIARQPGGWSLQT
jgi:hypothetical protein